MTLELYAVQDSPITQSSVSPILEKYKGYAGNKNEVQILPVTDVESLVSNAQEVDLDKAFLETVYNHIVTYRTIQAS